MPEVPLPVLREAFRDLLRGRFPLSPEREAHADGLLERLSWHKCLTLAASLSSGETGRLGTAFARVRVDREVAEEVYVRRVAAVRDGLAPLGVEFFPLKGPFWGSLVYPAGAARHLGDLDLLVPPDAAEPVHGLLEGLGYASLRPAGVTRASARAALEGHGEIAYRAAGPNGFVVEVHGSLVVSPRFRRSQSIDVAAFRAGGGTAEWRGFRYALPRREAWLLYVLLHGACHHQFARFLHLADLSFQWDRGGGDLGALAREWRVERAVYHSLIRLNAFRDAPIPPAGDPGSPWRRLLARPLTPDAILTADDGRGNLRRNLFRLAIA